jgi:hypothetical protein
MRIRASRSLVKKKVIDSIFEPLKFALDRLRAEALTIEPRLPEHFHAR